MANRREFLVVSGLSLAAMASTGSAPRAFDLTWLVYAPDAERFWSNLAFTDRLKKLGEAGFTRYEFGRWKTKDFGAIAKFNQDLGLEATLFLGYSGPRGQKWKEGLLEAAADSAELATMLGAVKAGLLPPERDENVDRADQVEVVVDALKEAVEKVAESEVVLILEPTKPLPSRPTPLIGTVEEAVEIVKSVGSDRLKFAFPIDRAAVAEGKVPDRIKAFKDQAGYYRLVDFTTPSEAERAGYARVLRTIHDVGYADPIGFSLPPKSDPTAAIEAIRKLDDAAKAL